jgi:hypothetical protein
MDVQFLHTGEPVLVIEAGEGEPGSYRRDATGRDVWTENADYKPARVVRLGAIEDVEQGQLAATLEETSTAARQAAIDAGEHPDREGAQFVHVPAAGGGTPVVGAGPTDAAEPTALGPDAARVPVERAAGAETDPLEPLNESERDELARLRAAQADNAERPANEGRDTTGGAANATT